MSRALYFDCFSGVSGDMVVAAFLDSGEVQLDAVQAGLAALPIHGEYALSAEKTMRGVLSATRFSAGVPSPREHASSSPNHGRCFGDIREMIGESSLSARVKDLALRIFGRLAEAEASVHGQEVEEVHFHEVGATDSIVDIVAAAIAVEAVRPETVVCSPLPMTRGFVHSRHGRLPLPAPAVAAMLQGVPIRGSDVPHELVTPTGAAIVTTLAQSFGPLPQMRVLAVGYGAGALDLETQPNVLRLFVGEAVGES